MPVGKIKVKPYYVKRKGKRVKITGHYKKRRKLGKKITYKSVGTFQVAHDNLGNFRGSRVIRKKK